MQWCGVGVGGVSVNNSSYRMMRFADAILPRAIESARFCIHHQSPNHQSPNHEQAKACEPVHKAKQSKPNQKKTGGRRVKGGRWKVEGGRQAVE